MSYFAVQANNWPELAFISGEITGKQYIDNFSPFMINNAQIAVHDGFIWVWSSKTKGNPWEQIQDYRSVKAYKDWRTQVFKRDAYTCQHCGTSNHDLNAHHIKKYHEFPKLRYTVTNGLTLCKKCHIDVHKGGHHAVV